MSRRRRSAPRPPPVAAVAPAAPLPEKQTPLDFKEPLRAVQALFFLPIFSTVLTLGYMTLRQALVGSETTADFLAGLWSGRFMFAAVAELFRPFNTAAVYALGVPVLLLLLLGVMALEPYTRDEECDAKSPWGLMFWSLAAHALLLRCPSVWQVTDAPWFLVVDGLCAFFTYNPLQKDGDPTLPNYHLSVLRIYTLGYVIYEIAVAHDLVLF